MNKIAAALMLLTELSKSYQKMYEVSIAAKVDGRMLNPDEIIVIDTDYRASFDNLDNAIEEREREEEKNENG